MLVAAPRHFVAAPRHFAEPVELAAELVELVVLLVELVAVPVEPAAVPVRLVAEPARLVALPALLLLQNHRPLLEPLVRNHRLLHPILESPVGFPPLAVPLVRLLEEILELAGPAGFVEQPVELALLGQCLERPVPNLLVVGLVQHFATP